MKAIILHESKGRIRFRIGQKKMTLQEADVLEKMCWKIGFKRNHGSHK